MGGNARLESTGFDMCAVDDTGPSQTSSPQELGQREMGPRELEEATQRAPEMDRLVRALASRVLAHLPRGCGLEMSDLIQAGNIGLLQAVRSFSPEIGVSLAGYAKFRIRGEMLDMVRRYRGGRDGAASALLHDAPFRGKDAGVEENNLEEKIAASPDESPLGLVARRERSAIIHQEIGKLPPRYRMVVRLRYSGECSLREIGVALRVRESRACQIHRLALNRLRRALWNRGVKCISQLI